MKRIYEKQRSNQAGMFWLWFLFGYYYYDFKRVDQLFSLVVYLWQVTRQWWISRNENIIKKIWIKVRVPIVTKITNGAVKLLWPKNRIIRSLNKSLWNSIFISMKNFFFYLGFRRFWIWICNLRRKKKQVQTIFLHIQTFSISLLLTCMRTRMSL